MKYLIKITSSNKLINISAETIQETVRHQGGAYFKITCIAELDRGSFSNPSSKKTTDMINQAMKMQNTTISDVLILEKSMAVAVAIITLWPNSKCAARFAAYLVS